MSRTLLASSWFPRIFKAMPSICSALLRILRFILSLCAASSFRKHSESGAVRASSMPSLLKQRETGGVSPSHMYPSPNLITDASRGMDPPTQPDDSMTGNPPVHFSQYPMSLLSLADRPHAAVPCRPVPASPQQVMEYRYLKRPLVDDRATSDRILKEGDMSYDPPSLPIGWMKCTQPEGALYYVHEEKRIITDLTESQQLLDTSDYLLDRARQLGLPFHLDVELVITEVAGAKETMHFGYYFVDHRQRLLFWVDDYDLSEVFFNVKGVTARDHMKQAVITQYWMHVGLYPNRRELKADDYEELRNILICAIADAATSQTPLAPFDIDSMTRILDLVEKLEGMLNSASLILLVRRTVQHIGSIGKENPYGVWVIARFSIEFSSSRFINFSGQPFARLDAGKSIYAPHDRPSSSGLSSLIRIIDLFLFRSASGHLEELKQMWVDQIVHYPSWQKYIAKLTSDWARFTIFSTVLLTTDVGLLAAPTLGGGGGGMTAATASVYLSIFFSVASILTSIQLTNRVSGKEYSSATSTVRTIRAIFDSGILTDCIVFGVVDAADTYK
ncbi:hypothetical protein EDD15DRAFT_2532651 [Pisolithus albus]|nr:hypothetical protein EDD15DRAFT_2532651 [Pisolithus albus]